MNAFFNDRPAVIVIRLIKFALLSTIKAVVDQVFKVHNPNPFKEPPKQ